MAHDHQTNVAHDCAQPPIIYDFSLVTSYVVLCATCLAAAFNILVIVCAVRIFNHNGVYTHVLIIMMSLGDLIQTVYPIPLSCVRFIVPSIQSEYLCASMQIAMWLGQAQSGLFLTAINVDRIIFFYWPLKYVLLTTKYVAVVCTSIATVIIGSIITLWASKSVYITNTCITTFANDVPIIAVTASTCVLPLVSSFVLSTYLFVLTERRRRRAVASAGTRQGNPRRRVNSLLFIFASSLWTLVSLVPSRSFLTYYYFAVYVHESPSNCPDISLFWLVYASNLLIRANPMVNPLITGLVCAPYRRELTRIFNEAKATVQRVCHAPTRE